VFLLDKSKRYLIVELTANIYTHIDQQEQIDAINALPGW
jgi:hypothetical protein